MILISIDTLRADHVGCYGYKQVETPAVDALATDGVRFTEAFTHSPITNTSHITILTGLLPSVHGVTDFAVPLTAVSPVKIGGKVVPHYSVLSVNKLCPKPQICGHGAIVFFDDNRAVAIEVGIAGP